MYRIFHAGEFVDLTQYIKVMQICKGLLNAGYNVIVENRYTIIDDEINFDGEARQRLGRLTGVKPISSALVSTISLVLLLTAGLVFRARLMAAVDTFSSRAIS